MSILDSFFNRGFQATKCKTQLKLTIPRIKLLRNRRELQIKQMRKDIAKLLETGQEPTARIRVEHIIREENMMAAQEIIELYCELISVRLPIIETQRECPLDLKEAIASVCFAAPRCADLPELQQVHMAFASKYGKEFVEAATGLFPDCGVNRQMIELLSIRAPSSEKKLKLLKDIANEHGLDWDPEACEAELFKSHEDLLDGSNQFVSGSKVPLPEEKHVEIQSAPVQGSGDQYHSGSDSTLEMLAFPEVPKAVPKANPYSIPPAKDEESPHLVIPSAPRQEQDEELSTSEKLSHQIPVLSHHRSENFEDTMVAKSDASYKDQIPLHHSSKDPHDALKSPETMSFENPTIARNSSQNYEGSFQSIGKDPESPKEKNIQFVPFMSAPQLSPQTSLEREGGQGETHPHPAVHHESIADMLLATQRAAETAERAAAHPLPAAETDNLADLKDVILATQRAAETAERAATAARSAASFAQLKISELSDRKREQSPDPISDNPFSTGDCDPGSTRFSPSTMDQDKRDSSANSDEVALRLSSQADSQTPPNVSSSFPQFDSFGRLSSSSSLGDNTLDRDNSLHVPHRMSSADEETYLAYPNLFGSGNQSFKETTRSNS